jgi:hypothetical protein
MVDFDFRTERRHRTQKTPLFPAQNGSDAAKPAHSNGLRLPLSRRVSVTHARATANLRTTLLEALYRPMEYS